MNTLPREMTLEVYSYPLSPSFYHLHNQTHNNTERRKNKRSKKFQHSTISISKTGFTQFQRVFVKGEKIFTVTTPSIGTDRRL